MSPLSLTPRQLEVHDFITRFHGRYGYAPTIAEIREHFGLRSVSGVHQLLQALERAGVIERQPHVSRGIRLLQAAGAEGDCEVPLYGVVAAGRPVEAVLNRETVCVPRDLVGPRTFALRVRGDSMIGAQISDGDILVVEGREGAKNGQLAVALVDGAEATVKFFHQERGRVRLEAANPNYRPIIIRPPQRVRVQGVVVGVIRRYPR